MKTKKHWDECKQLPSYDAALRFALQLKEAAKAQGFDPHGIKVFSKEEVYQHGRIADSEVRWCNGPLNWPKKIGFTEVPGICIESHDCFSVSFYDIEYPTLIQAQG